MRISSFIIAVFTIFVALIPYTGTKAETGYPVISPENIDALSAVKTLSKGYPALQWSDDGQILIAATESGYWLYPVSPVGLTSKPRQLQIPVIPTPSYWRTADGKIARDLFTEIRPPYIRVGAKTLEIPYPDTHSLWNPQLSSQATYLAYMIDQQTHIANLWNGVEHVVTGFPIAFSPDETILVTAPDSKTLNLWYSSTGKLLRALPGGATNIYPVVFSPNSTFVAAYEPASEPSNPQQIRLWRTKQGDPVATFDHAKIVGFSFDSAVFAYDSQVKSPEEQKYFDLNTLSERTFGIPSGARVHSAGRKQYSVSSGRGGGIQTYYFWKRLNFSRIVNAWSQFAFYTKDSVIVQNYLDDKQRVFTHTALLRERYPGILSPTLMYVASFEDDATLRISESRTDREVARFDDFLGYVDTPRLSPDSTKIAVASYLFEGVMGRSASPIVLKLWDLKKDAKPTLLLAATGDSDQYSNFFSNLRFSSDSKRLLATGNYNGSTVSQAWWDVESGKTHFDPANNDQTIYVLSPNGKFSVIAGTDPAQPAILWNDDTNTAVLVLNNCSAALGAFSPDSRYFVCPSSSSEVTIWNLQTAQQLTKLNGCQARIRDELQFTPDTKLLVCTRQYVSTGINVLDIASGKVVFQMDGISIISAHNETLLIQRPGSINLLDLKTGTETIVYSPGQGNFMFHGVFSPDGRLLVVNQSTPDTLPQIDFWDVQAHRLVRTIRKGLGGYTQFNMDGTQLVISSNGYVQLWAVK